ncbi:GTP-binding protein, putative [Plasmodium knowlesi strain H]|uniref:GTP-binding protein, putative n=3 Tax=Plasmodium knowlesi TaxID=5850 RepID=A0A5K1VHL0_PLAKH|nr:GTP-binding protein, putative [Plasmodium knowlesi strain H]OTN65385.1 putative GTP-binding protein [Plasmodium knowlesi]CAA9989728.1 GTP-binding protein, putative [Plasmodium knowlesi strain H]SBO22882.1 GTP-binding protein, putative [Plasmodium knowlesi strain H]SBO23019.1 GTP-binding protein, putative [Plasmodium knowlesi strain H]VVS79202.1 GTP-binding protein, putative [Plasmodium knowlesi strain H]|eukprot:XP_002260451.1 probable GTP-binding protein, putative [Plasmodium knowlesi strain H]
MQLLGQIFRRYASLRAKLRAEQVSKSVGNDVRNNMVNRVRNDANGVDGEAGSPNGISRRQRERNTKIDVNIYEQLKRKMLGKPLNKVQRKYLKEKRPNFAPIFLDQLKPRMILYKTAIQVSELPLPKYPEIAFIGRSNSGKSTLINELCGRTNKAKVSKLPGCTKEIHFYKIAKPCLLCLVDLPGYGFAHSKEELRLQWNEFTLFYLKNRKNLKKVFVLIDCRVGLKTSDKELLHFFDRYNIKYQIVFSKCDLLNTKDLAVKIQIANEEIACFKNLEAPIIPLSSLKRQNLNELRKEIARYQLNKTIVKNNIVMKINDLIEQKRLKKLAVGVNGHANNDLSDINRISGTVDDQFNRSTGNTSDGSSTKSKNRTLNVGETLSKDILLSDDTISEALNRWKKLNKAVVDTPFNKYMGFHMKRIINTLQEKFLRHCREEFDDNDLNIIDDVIEKCGKLCHKNENSVDPSSRQITDEEQFCVKNTQSHYIKGTTYMQNKQRKYKKGLESRKEQLEGDMEKKHLEGETIDDKSSNKHVIVDLPPWEMSDVGISEKIDGNENEKTDIRSNETISEETWDMDKWVLDNNARYSTNDLEDPESNEHKNKTDDYSNISLLSSIDSMELEKELLLDSLLLSDEKRKNKYEYHQCENVKMDNLFGENKNKSWSEQFKREDYSKVKDNILLEEEDTYAPEDYASGLKRSKAASQNGDILSNYTFNMKDKGTHQIYEKIKSDAYKMYRSRQLENLDIQTSSGTPGQGKNLQKGETHTIIRSASQGDKTRVEKNSPICSGSADDLASPQGASSTNRENTHVKKHYIGLKTRSTIIKGTKKLKLFGKKRTTDIVHVPVDLATDYFKLSNNSTIYDKKKNSWNYINSKYNKWLKKMTRKRVPTEITGPVKKVDVMVRYAEKQESKYKKEKNKMLMRKKNLGMITKPPNHKKGGKISRNYTLSDEQKIFDREAFFKYRDVQK